MCSSRGQIGQGPSAVDVLLVKPVAVDYALAPVVLGPFVQRDAVFGGQPRQGLPGEAGLLRDVVERLMLVNVLEADRYRVGTRAR